MLEKLLRREPYLDSKKVKKKTKTKHLTRAQKGKLDPTFRARVRYSGMSYEEWVKKYPHIYDKDYRTPSIVKCITRRKQTDIRFKTLSNKRSLSAVHKKRGKLKTCTHCGKEYGLGFFEFTRDPEKSQSTRKSYCYTCRKKINHENYLKNKEKIKAKNAAYYAANKEKLKQTMKENYARRSGKNIK